MGVLDVPDYIWRRLCMVNLVVIVFILAIGYGLPAVHAQNVSLGGARDCTANSVVWCGVGSVSELVNKYNGGDGHNSAASIQHIFGWFGISRADVEALPSTAQAGSVTRGGDVFVGGKLVATGALTGGRQNMSGACGGSTRVVSQGTAFFTRRPCVSFVSSPLSAFVVMHSGRFAFAILSSCGNAVIAKPTAPPAKPVLKPKPVTPAPKPTPQPQPQPAPAPTPAPTQTTANVCSGNVSNTTSAPAAQGGNCSTNTTIVQSQNQAPPPATTTVQATPAPTPAPAAQTSSQPVSVTPASTLVNTGPGNLAVIFVAASTAGTLVYRWWLVKHRISIHT